MALIFLRSSDGNDGNAGTDKSAPKATLAAALTAAGAGGRVEVSSLHAESTAANLTEASAGTANSWTDVICVPDWGAASGTTSVGSKTTGATVTANGNFSITLTGFAYSYGVAYNGGSGTSGTGILFGSGTSAFGWVIEAGNLNVPSTNSTRRITIGTTSNGPAASKLTLINTSMTFGNASQGVVVQQAAFDWFDSTAIVGGTTPTTLFPVAATRFGYVRVVRVDLSALASGKNLVEAGGALSRFLFRRCKLGSSVSVRTGTPAGPGDTDIDLIDCDSADTNYREYRGRYEATVQQETTIVRSGGASDGVTTVSRKVTTASTVTRQAYFRSEPILFWVPDTAQRTITVPIVTDGVTVTDAKVWLEVEYPGTSGYPLGVLASDRVADPIFGSGANQPTDSASSWTTTGLTSPVKQTLDVTLTPVKAGLLLARVCVAEPSLTVYFDPKALTTSGRQYMSEAGMVNEGAGGVLFHTGMSGGVL